MSFAGLALRQVMTAQATKLTISGSGTAPLPRMLAWHNISRAGSMLKTDRQLLDWRRGITLAARSHNGNVETTG
jgi:hypothetical protein